MRAQGGKKAEKGKAFVPEVLYQGKYYPICGHYFWDNDTGATLVCKALGFKVGKYTSTRVAYHVDAMPVGDCKAGEKDLTKCTGGGNAWGKFEDRNGWCKKGQQIGVTVTCDTGACSRVRWLFGNWLLGFVEDCVKDEQVNGKVDGCVVAATYRCRCDCDVHALCCVFACCS